MRYVSRWRQIPLGVRVALWGGSLSLFLLGYWREPHLPDLWRVSTLGLVLISSLLFPQAIALVQTIIITVAKWLVEASHDMLPGPGAMAVLLAAAIFCTIASQHAIDRIALLQALAVEAKPFALVLDRSMRVVWVSPKANRFWPVDVQTLVGKRLTEWSVPDHRAMMIQQAEAALAHGGPCYTPLFLLKHNDGSTPVTVSFWRLPVLSHTYVLGSIELVHPDDLRNRMLRAAADSIHTGVALCSVTGDLLWGNTLFTNILAGETGLVADSPAKTLPELIQQTPPGESLNTEVTLEDGRILDLALYPVGDEDGRFLAKVVLLRDVTEQVQSRIRMEQSERLVAVGQLAAGIAHNINNILGAISVNTEVLRMGIPKELEHITEDILLAVQRGTEVVGKLYKLAGSGAQPQSDRLELKPHLDGVIRWVQLQAERQEVALSLQVPAGLCVRADANLLHQVLLNLTLNAIQAMPSGGQLVITAERIRRNRVCIAVMDTGSGIPPESMPKVFTPFFTTRQGSGGTGLGLSTSLTMVRAMDGKIHVESTVGRGTTVRVELPEG